jgi:hypothetical protein
MMEPRCHGSRHDLGLTLPLAFRPPDACYAAHGSLLFTAIARATLAFLLHHLEQLRKTRAMHRE